MPKISIIVPVYNVEKYLPTCLDSLVNQTFNDIEIICINDGSTDGSLNILKEYAEKDDRVIIIDKENSGPGACRNIGIEKARGEYILFVDSDDWIEKETCEICYQKATKHNVDMISFNTNKVLLNKIEPIYYYDIKDERIISWKDIDNKLFKFPFHSCHYLIKKNFLINNAIQYPKDIFWLEDVPFVLKCWLSCKQVYIIPNTFYNYIQRECSITHKNIHFFDLFKVIPLLKKQVSFSKMDVLEKELVFWIIKHFKWIYENLKSKSDIERMINKAKEIDCFYECQKAIDQIDSLSKDLLHIKLFKIISLISIKSKNKIIRFRFMGIPLFSIKKKSNPQTNIFYLFDKIQLLKKVKTEKIKYYLFGIKVWTIKTNFKKIRKNIISLHSKFVLNGKFEGLIICFDSLDDENVEAIDAYSFFCFLQKKGIPSKYVLLKSNPLYKNLEKQNKLKDVLAIEKNEVFCEKYQTIIAQTKIILTSFGLRYKENIFLKKLSFLEYIFIEHGVTLLKKWVVSYYNTNVFDKILVPTKATWDFYSEKKLYVDNQVIKCGFPRWDRLKKEDTNIKNIFLFFTWRYTKNKNELSHYFKKINEFVYELQNKVRHYSEVKIYLALHHCLMNKDIYLPQYENIEIISPNNISSMIGKTDLFITDYSSLCFDFMYLDIPTIFYRFDENIVYSDKRDLDSFLSAKEEDKRLYNCFYSINDVMNKVQYYIKNNFVLETENKHKNEKIFWKEKQNCENLLRALR